MTDLRNYFMKPKQMKNGLNIYPIKIMEYEEFRLLATKYIVLNILQLNNQRKQLKQPLLEQDNLYDYLIMLASSGNNANELIKYVEKIKKLPKKQIDSLIERDESIGILLQDETILKKIKEEDYMGEIVKLFEMVLHQEVIFNKELKLFEIGGYDKDMFIDKSNFDEFRDIVMEQNLLFEPIIAPTIKAQKYIDASLNGNGGESCDMESLIAFVCTNSSITDISEYTYYRLMADFYSLIKQLNRNDLVMYSAGGSTKKNGRPLDIPNVVGKLNVNKNPYDDVFKEVDKN